MDKAEKGKHTSPAKKQAPKKIVFKNGSVISFREYDAGKELGVSKYIDLDKEPLAMGDIYPIITPIRPLRKLPKGVSEKVLEIVEDAMDSELSGDAHHTEEAAIAVIKALRKAGWRPR